MSKEMTTLEESCHFFNGKAHEKNIDAEGDFVVVNSRFISTDGRVKKFTGQQKFPLFENDIVMVMSDVPNGKALAKCRIIEENDKYSLNQRICAIRTDEYDIRFLYYQLNRNPYLLAFNNGENQTNLRKGDILKCPLWKPSIEIQKQIVILLDAAFAKIDQAKANIEKNIANAKELFQSKLNEIFSQKGDGWEEKKMDEVCEIKSKLINPMETKYKELLHVGGGNIVAETGELIELKTAQEEGLKSGKFAFDTSVVLYNKIRPYLVKVARPSFKGLCSADMYPLTPNEEQITRDFLYFLLISNDFTKYAISGSARAGMPKVNRKHLFGYTFPLPSIKTQNTIIKSLDSLHRKSKVLEFEYRKKIDILEELKKSLLQKAFIGELISTNLATTQTAVPS